MKTAIRLCLRHPVGKLDGEAVQCGFPFPYRHRPLLANGVERKVEQLADSLISRKGTAALGDLSQAHISQFDRVGGVDHLADSGG